MSSSGGNSSGVPDQLDNLIQYFQKAGEADEAWFKILDMFPFPIEIFAPDGTSVYINRALVKLTGISDANLVVGKYNLLKDPVCNDQLGYRTEIKRAFNGEAVTCKGFPFLIQILEDQHIIKEKPFEKATMDLYLFPVCKDDKLHFVVNVFMVKALYFDRPDLTRAEEYLDTHWQDEYDSHTVAESVNMSERQLYNLFKRYAGTTPGEYLKMCKIEHIKEKLADKNLSIKEVFASCGENSHGWFAKVFKEATGMSPKEYRDSIK